MGTDLRGDRALVTGGAGFIGSHVVDALVAGGTEVVVLDDLSTGYRRNIHPEAELVEGDVADEAAVATAVAGCQVVFHQAAHKAVLRSVEHPLHTDRTNTAGTLTVLVAARDAGVRRVVAASSSSVYGGSQQLPTPESAPLVPGSPYAVSKVAGEQYCRVFWELFGLETVSLRYFNVYGSRQRPDSRYAAVVPLFVEALRTGAAAEVHGDGRQSRDFTHVYDAVQANLKAAAAPAEACAGRAYNVAGGQAHSVLDVLELLADLIGVAPRATHTGARPGDVRHSLADLEAVTRDLGYEPTVTLRDGLARVIGWFGERSEGPDENAGA